MTPTGGTWLARESSEVGDSGRRIRSRSGSPCRDLRPVGEAGTGSNRHPAVNRVPLSASPEATSAVRYAVRTNGTLPHACRSRHARSRPFPEQFHDRLRMPGLTAYGAVSRCRHSFRVASETTAHIACGLGMLTLSLATVPLDAAGECAQPKLRIAAARVLPWCTAASGAVTCRQTGLRSMIRCQIPLRSLVDSWQVALSAEAAK